METKERALAGETERTEFNGSDGKAAPLERLIKAGLQDTPHEY